MVYARYNYVLTTILFKVYKPTKVEGPPGPHPVVFIVRYWEILNLQARRNLKESAMLRSSPRFSHGKNGKPSGKIGQKIPKNPTGLNPHEIFFNRKNIIVVECKNVDASSSSFWNTYTIAGCLSLNRKSQQKWIRTWGTPS